MAFTVSPGIVTREIDLTAIVPEVGSTTGGVAGSFRWGPISEVTLVSSEDDLVSRFHKPDTETYNYFFTAANFLSYGNALNVVRVTNSAAKNATDDGANNVLIKNSDLYYETYDTNFGGTASSDFGTWAAKYAGSLGNSLKVSICGADKPCAALTGTVTVAAENAGAHVVTGVGTTFTTEVGVGDVIDVASNNYIVTAIANTTQMTVAGDSAAAQSGGSSATRLVRSGFETTSCIGTVTVAAGNTALSGTNTKFQSQMRVGDIITIGGEEEAVVKTITSDTAIVLESPVANAASSNTYTRKWEYHGSVDSAPTTTVFGERKGTTQDEIHIIISDEDGEWTGTKGQVLEAFPNLSVASDAKAEDGTSLYYKEKINRASKYIWWMKHNGSGARDTSLNTIAWGASANSAVAPQFQANAIIATTSLSLGVDGNTLGDGDMIFGFEEFQNEEFLTDVSVIPTANSNATVIKHVIQNIAEKRKDCMVFASPRLGDVLATGAAASIVSFRNSLPSTSYASIDSGYKYQYDRYNDVYRYVPLNGDVAGCVVRTTEERDFFFSPAGFTRGQIKNVVKLPFNPDKVNRDLLYKNGINPVVSFTGQGTILFGDKTLLAKPSAFDRINVRRLFISLEKSISIFAQQQLFEFNDEFTRARFVATVEPFLRDIQGRGGITDFSVVCDESNNTAEVIDRNEFVGSIFIKPTRAINFILLNFVAVRSGVEFSEITNAI